MKNRLIGSRFIFGFDAIFAMGAARNGGRRTKEPA